jgi:hypothetical protein
MAASVLHQDPLSLSDQQVLLSVRGRTVIPQSASPGSHQGRPGSRLLIGQETDMDHRQFPACRHHRAPQMLSRLSACRQHQLAEAIGYYPSGEING